MLELRQGKFSKEMCVLEGDVAPKDLMGRSLEHNLETLCLSCCAVCAAFSYTTTCWLPCHGFRL